MKNKYIYICATSRSGSTLLDMLLGGHSEGVSLGEFSYLGKAIALEQMCGCNMTVVECKVWNDFYTQVLLEKKVNFKKTPYVLRQWDTRAAVLVDKKQQTRTYLFFCRLRAFVTKLHFRSPSFFKIPMPSLLKKGIENTAYLYDTVLKTRKKRFVIDSSKNFLKAIALYKRFPESTKVLLLTRDGRGVFHSRYCSGFSKKESLLGWYKFYSEAFFYLKRFVSNKDLLVVRYEDLMADLEGELKRICIWAEIDFEKKMMKLDEGERHLVNGNGTRFKRHKGVKLDERWRSELSDEDLKWFMNRAGVLNAKLGYK